MLQGSGITVLEIVTEIRRIYEKSRIELRLVFGTNDQKFSCFSGLGSGINNKKLKLNLVTALLTLFRRSIFCLFVFLFVYLFYYWEMGRSPPPPPPRRSSENIKEHKSYDNETWRVDSRFLTSVSRGDD